ncbi:hypothetical protein [Burkholderia anthina]|uniref:hypothetical protein n=1 Tax=Burkholderia anthina TaxID=179879 RepID=UPI001AA020EB|nr:hypothetical protein [Burkholderia anthina]QTD95202.1 hypothetical protein J4G50_34945 [Burkholderia anthina]
MKIKVLGTSKHAVAVGVVRRAADAIAPPVQPILFRGDASSRKRAARQAADSR